MPRILLRTPAVIYRYLILVLLAYLLFTTRASYAASPQIIHWQLQAEKQAVHNQRAWQVLLHYSPTDSAHYRSKIDDPKFFLAPNGMTDGRAELQYNIAALFTPSEQDGDYYACRFPARYAWLKTQLAIPEDDLPAFRCTKRDKALASVEANSAVLVFPVGHINSPASMFGHTLIRIDGSSKSNLISYAANYSASTTDTNGFKYAWKGLTGGYRGYFSMMPYYLKVKEYNDLEHRDMWEYRLTLSEAEVRRMVDHIWELQDITTAYYFLDENCSYNLLFLVEAARPTLRLIEKTGVLVLPTDTVRIVIDSGIVADVQYRPSQGTKIRTIISLLDEAAQRTAHRIATSEINADQMSSLSRDLPERIKILDLAASFVQFRYHKNEIDKQAFQKQYLAILRERSLLGAAPDNLYAIAQPPPPESGHDTSMLAFGGGIRHNRAFVEVKARPEFHGLLDPDQGYLPGAQIKFLDTAVRYTPATNRFQLKTMQLLDILSLAPRDTFFKPLSWKVRTGFDSEPLKDGRDHLIYRLNTGGGLTYRTPWNGMVYLFGEADLNLGEHLPEKATIGPLVSIGLLEQLTERWKLAMHARAGTFRLGDKRDLGRLTIASNFRISRNNSITLECSHELVNSKRISEASSSWNYYF